MSTATIDHELTPNQMGAAALAGLGAFLAVLGLISGNSLAVLVVVLAGFLGLAALAWPSLSTLAVLFVLYSNLAVVAIKFHNVPYVLGAGVPLALLIPLAYYVAVRRDPLIVDRVSLLIVLFLAVQLAGTMISSNVPLSLGILVTSLVEGLALYLLILNVIRTPTMLRRSVWALLAAGALMAVVPVYQQVTGKFTNDFGGLGQVSEGSFTVADEHEAIRQPRLAGTIGEQNRFAQVMLMLVVLGAFAYQIQPVGMPRLLVGIATALAAIGCGLTFSRGAVVAAALTLIVLGMVGYIPMRRVALCGLLMFGALLLTPQYRVRIASLLTLQSFVSEEGATAALEPDGALKGRMTEMTAAFQVFRDHPLLGVGPGMFKFYSEEYSRLIGIRQLVGTRQAHNLYLGVAADHGVLGFFSFFAIPVVMLFMLDNVRRRCRHSHPEISALATGFFAAILVYLTTGLFLHFSYVRYFWMMLAMGGATVHIARRLNRSELAQQELSVAEA